MLRKLAVTISLLLATMACNEGITAPTETYDFEQNAIEVTQLEPDNLDQSVVVVNQNEWQTWPITWFTACATQQFVSGNMRVHLQSQTKTLSDGTSEFRQHLNVPSAKLVDNLGVEYNFIEVSNGTWITLPNSNFEMDFSYRYKMIAKGKMPNEFVTLSIHLIWDGVEFTDLSTNMTSCHG